MTKEEVRNAVQELIKQLPDNCEAFFVITDYEDDSDTNTLTCGVGCPRCMIDLIKNIENDFEHNVPLSERRIQ